MDKILKGAGIWAGVVLISLGALLSACEDFEEIEITGPALEEVIAAAQSAPGTNSFIRYHGYSLPIRKGPPLIYIDGVRWFEGQDETGSADAQSTTSLGGIEASDIEKISIVRGTKAVITYGPDAENGVILITLKDSVSKRESPR